jgi:predicted anti-sigma-YlaC factor YlaD
MGQLPSNDCDRLREQVSASLDGELSQLESARLQAHLAGCGSCRAFAATAGAASQLLQAAPLEELQFAVALPSRRRLAAARKLQVAAAAAALTVTVGLSAALGTLGSQPRVHASARAVHNARLRFPEQELKMLHQASEARANLVVHSRFAT